MSFMVWLGLPNANKVLATAMTQVGTWSTFPEYNQTSKYSVSVGATQTTTVNGTTVYVSGWTAASGQNQTQFDVLIDGVSQGPFSLLAPGAAAVFPYTLRFAGLAAGNHTVQFKCTSATNRAILLWFAGNGPQGVTKPIVLVGGAIPRVEQPDQSLKNLKIQGVVDQLRADGLAVGYVDDGNSVSLAASPTEYQTDQIHPNNLGQTLIAQTWMQMVR